MPAPRAKPLDLARLFQATALPVCLLDDESRIAYVNPALEGLCHSTADELVGTPCRFQLSAVATRAQLIAAALAPPPELSAGLPITRTVELPAMTGDSTPHTTTYIPVSDGTSDATPILIVIAPLDVAEAAQHARGNAPADLHNELQRFRTRYASRYRVDFVAGNGPAARRLRAQLEVASGSTAHVVITGAAGSGRRGVARAIHLAHDPQNRAPLPVVAAPTATSDVLHAALSALTRASQQSPPDSTTARPTLLVTDIDQLSAELQGDLWRTLRSSAAWRILATSSRSLIDMARAGEFHVELAHLLSTIEIPLVSLGERREDIPLLAQALLEEVNGRVPRQHTGFSPEALDLLAAYSWPGGFAELAEIVERAHRQGEGPVVTSRDLDDRVRLGHVARRRETEPIVLDRFMTEIEKEVITRALKLAKGNKARAARLLGLTRPRLYRRMEQLGIEDGTPPAL